MISRFHRLLPALLAVDALLLALGIGSFIMARHDHSALPASRPPATRRSLASRPHPATATPVPRATPIPATAIPSATPIPATPTATSIPATLTPTTMPIPATPTPRPTRVPATPARSSTPLGVRHHNPSLAGSGNQLAGARVRHFHQTPQVTDWKAYDTAVFVASTLNLPRCSGGAPLSAVLAQHGARSFVVMHSSHDQSLYFIQVRAGDRGLLGVYAYRLGWKDPQSVQGGQCARAAPPQISAGYRDATMLLAGRFTSPAPA